MYSLARFNLENDFRQCVLLNSYPSQTHALKEKNFARATKHFSLNTKSPRNLVMKNENSIYLGRLTHCKRRVSKRKRKQTTKEKEKSIKWGKWKPP